MKLATRLKKLEACSDAVAWCGDRDLETAWRECERPDWMLWLISRSKDEKSIDTRAVVRCSVAACRMVMESMPAEAIPAIEIAERYGNGETIDPAAARSAAWSAVRSAARSAAWSAESAVRSAARSAAWSAESAAWSAESAVRSAESAARSAAWSAALKKLADVVRFNFPQPPEV